MIVAIQSMGVPRLYYARETCYHKSNGGFAGGAGKCSSLNCCNYEQLCATPWHADRRSAQGWRSQTEGESRRRTEESLLSSGRFRLSPATGGRQCRLPVLSAWLLRRTQPSLVLSLYAPRYCLTASAGFGRQFAKLRALSRLRRRYDSRKYRFPRSPRPPRPLTAGSCGCTWQFASFFSCLAASCAARSDSAVSA